MSIFDRDIDTSIRTYTVLCKSNDINTIKMAINNIQSNYDTKTIARNTCISTGTIDRVKTLYNHIGGSDMHRIANKLCLCGDIKNNMTGGSKVSALINAIEVAGKVTNAVTDLAKEVNTTANELHNLNNTVQGNTTKTKQPNNQTTKQPNNQTTKQPKK